MKRTNPVRDKDFERAQMQVRKVESGTPTPKPKAKASHRGKNAQGRFGNRQRRNLVGTQDPVVDTNLIEASSQILALATAIGTSDAKNIIAEIVVGGIAVRSVDSSVEVEGDACRT